MTDCPNIRSFLMLFPDDRLAALLAHAQDGKLSFHSCCCLVGAINAPHALKGEMTEDELMRSETFHLHEARRLPRARLAENEYNIIGFTLNNVFSLTYEEADAVRRRRLIPMIENEMTRRALERAVPEEKEEYVYVEQPK